MSQPEGTTMISTIKNILLAIVVVLLSIILGL